MSKRTTTTKELLRNRGIDLLQRATNQSQPNARTATNPRAGAALCMAVWK
jgi:hypothetical protein